MLSFFAYGKLSMSFLVAFFFLLRSWKKCENHSSRRPFQFESCTAVLLVRIFRQHEAINLSVSYNGKVIGGKYYTNLSITSLYDRAADDSGCCATFRIRKAFFFLARRSVRTINIEFCPLQELLLPLSRQLTPKMIQLFFLWMLQVTNFLTLITAAI